MYNKVLSKETSTELTIAKGFYGGSTHERENERENEVWLRGRLNQTKILQTGTDPISEYSMEYLRRKGKRLIFTGVSKHDLMNSEELLLFGHLQEAEFEKAYTYSLEASSIIPTKRISKEDVLSVVQSFAGKSLAGRVAEVATQVKTGADLLLAIYTQKLEGFSSDDLQILQDSFIDEFSIGRELVKAQLRPYLGKGNSYAGSMYDAFGLRAVDVMKENPWIMLLSVPRMTLRVCDEVAMALGISLKDPRRVKTLIMRAIQHKTESEQSTYIAEDDMDAVFELMGGEISRDDFDDLLSKGIDGVVHSNIGYHLSYHFYGEFAVYEMAAGSSCEIGLEIDDDWISEQEANNSILLGKSFKFSEDQRTAIKESVRRNLYILTGGPGTGKTTTLKTIVEANEVVHDLKPYQVALMAPTGKAAKRMSESIGRPATTIHRALQLQPGTPYSVNGAIKALARKQVKLLVVDESSMLDANVSGAIFATARGLDARIILVGDTNQLPPISSGQTLLDLVSGGVPHTQLTVTHRQDDDSHIRDIEQALRAGDFPSAEWISAQPDLEFIQVDANNIATVMLDVVKNNPEATILTPYRNPGYLGPVDTCGYINELAQSIHNPQSPDKAEYDDAYTYKGEKERGRLFRVGDRIMSTVNRDDIANGSLGTIHKISTDPSLRIIVEFDGAATDLSRFVTYTQEDLNQLELAYALTIHKSQGSEYDTVIIPLARGASQFVNNNLIYTAITRAKKKLILMGNIETFKSAAKMLPNKRETMLQLLLEGHQIRKI